MALFDKLFSLKRRLDADNCGKKDRSRSYQINPEQVRLLLFKECDWRGRRLLFDSSAIQKVPAGKHDKPSVTQDELPCIVEIADGFSYMYKGPEEDATVLGEMIFGAVAMNYKSVSLKIHIMDEPRRLMCTKVFCVPTSRRISRVERKTSDRTDTSFSSVRNPSVLRNASKPLNVPSLKEDGVALSFSMDRGDSGFCGDLSPYSSVGSTKDYFSMFDAWDGSSSQEDFYSFHSLPGRKLSTSSNGSWQRRTFQNIATRFELGHSLHHLNVPTGSDSQIYSNSSASGTSESMASGSSLPPRKSKLGLAVLISVADAAQLDLVRKCVEHSPQLQALVCRLRLATLAAGAGASFVSTLHRASEDAARWLSNLIYGPRVQPTWLAMVTSDARTSGKLADTLLSDLCSVLAVGDTKTTNFFISTLLTHVLTYHLGWVTTVSPYDTVDHQPLPSDPRRPYNVLWAQLSDLCGSIGFPSRAARTIISGEKNTQFVNRLLSILAYFLRCGDVKRTEYRYRECAIKETKTISVNKVARSAPRYSDVEVPVNTQNSESVNTLVASDVSLRKTATLADLRHQLSSSPECGSSSAGLKSCALKRNPTVMLSSLKASSDSSLNSTVSNDSVPEQKVVFVLGDDEKLIGLKNKSTNGKSVKKSSRVQTEPAEPRDECEKEGCEVRSTESPSKCCGQTLQHSKPIKHSGFKFEFDKYPQIVTNYMKSKNLEILDRHYIGKPGNLKLDNFQFDPMIVPPIQEERCDACEKCQLMESMLQTPTNASEMEYMNDMPRISEPQYAKETVVTDKDRNHRELSPKTFVRRRKVNVVVVNLTNNSPNSEDNNASESNTVMKQVADKTVSHVIISPETPKISIQDVAMDSRETNSEFRPMLRSKLRFTKSTNNLKSLLSQELEDSFIQTDELDIANKLNNHSLAVELSSNKISTPNSKESNTQNRSNLNLNDMSKSTSEISNVAKLNCTVQDLSSNEDLTSSTEMKITIPPLLKPIELRRPEPRRVSRERERDRVVEVKRVTELALPELCECKLKKQSSGFDGSLLGGLSDHYVPDLILQGTIEKPSRWEGELRRDLDVTSYLNKQTDTMPVQAVAIIGDTNTWEVRVVGRECGTSGMSSLVGAMLDALPTMWRAKVPAHQCLSFLEHKLREFCVLSKTLADMLMSTDFCDIATLTKSLNIDVNDVPLLLAVATTHTPQVATRYGISYR